MGYKKISIKKKIVCSGDMNRKIELGERTLSASNEGMPQYEFTVLVSPYAMIDTVSPNANFDGINTDKDQVSHVFYIKHITTFKVDIKHVIKFEDNYYKIMKVTDSEEMHIIDILYTTLKGATTKDGSEW